MDGRMIERIYIPTVRRANNQITFNSLPKELQERVVMVVEPGERHLYDYDCEYLELPEEVVGSWTQLAQTRLFIHKHAGAIKYCVTDDDILFKRRNSKYWTGKSNFDKTKRKATHEDVALMFGIFDTWLDEPSIGVVGLSDAGAPPPDFEYADTQPVYSCVFYDGRMLSEVIDSIDICSLRIAEDVLFLFEVLSRGINTRKSVEWIFDNRSMHDKTLQESRIVWTEMYEDGEEKPVDFFHSKEHYDAMKFIQKRYPHAVKTSEKDGNYHVMRYWKKVYRPKTTSLEDLFND